ncbi:choline ABC transporter substrate-binding protein [Bacterioplanes sanyensis]|uniref:choline ABC transporter substrate-binding protein n=1 Tax=Bacterioplanes sanyensis TaxID=1249553 RepID=UPI001678A6FF|nr:choline ABC transporter substrate-binding protein [Bacterioplanes sanyensis]
MKKIIVTVMGLIAACVPVTSWAQCQSVRFAQVSWTDVQATTAVASELLRRLGYDVEVKEMSVPEVYSSLAASEVDAFLGNWMPSMQSVVAPYKDSGAVEVLAENLQGAKYTLAVPDYVYNAGVRHFEDLARFKERFDGRIYGLEKGNDGNGLLFSMIEANEFGMAGFDVMELPERLMLRQVERHVRDQQWIAFLAWAPHPMNNQFDLHYLAGGDAYFGPDYGGATVYTNVRRGFTEQCPNAAKLLSNLQFDVRMEGQMMDMILNEFVPADRAVRAWMHANPQVVSTWLDGVTSQQGESVDAAQLAKAMKLTFGS